MGTSLQSQIFQRNGLLGLVLCAVIAVLLAACGQMPQPFGKEAPIGSKAELVTPPWQALVKAGPGASKDLDLETLNGPQAAPDSLAAEELNYVAAEPPPAADKAAPNRPTKTIRAVAVLPVTGNAPAGNEELAAAMRDTLTKAGWPVRAKASKDTLTIAGKVRLGEPRGTSQTVTLAWEVSSPDGNSLGLVSQTNDVPAGALDKGWGEQAAPAVEAAAAGIFELIDKFR